MTELEKLQAQLDRAEEMLVKENEKKQQQQLKITELRKKKNNILNTIKKRKSEKERKARTKRLIELGGLVEKYAKGKVKLSAFEAYCEQYQFALSQLEKEQ